MKLINFANLMKYSEAGIVTSENNLTWEGLRMKKFGHAAAFVSQKQIIENSHYGYLLLHDKWRNELTDIDNANTPDPDCVMVEYEADGTEDWWLLWSIENIK